MGWFWPLVLRPTRGDGIALRAPKEPSLFLASDLAAIPKHRRPRNAPTRRALSPIVELGENGLAKAP